MPTSLAKLGPVNTADLKSSGNKLSTNSDNSLPEPASKPFVAQKTCPSFNKGSLKFSIVFANATEGTAIKQ